MCVTFSFRASMAIWKTEWKIIQVCSVWDAKGKEYFCDRSCGIQTLVYGGWGPGPGRAQHGVGPAGGIPRTPCPGLCTVGPSLVAWWSVHQVLFVLQIQGSEEGLLYAQGLASTFGDVCCWWVGPWNPVVRIFHPTFIKPVLFAPGRHWHDPSWPAAKVSVLPQAVRGPPCRQEGLRQ